MLILKKIETSIFLECAADGVFESHFKSHTKPVLTADKNYRIIVYYFTKVFNDSILNLIIRYGRYI